jgi:carbonic anhydrase
VFTRRVRVGLGAMLGLACGAPALCEPPTTQVCSQTSRPSSQQAVEHPTPAAALERLRQGNERYVNDTPAHAHQYAKRRVETVENGQHPFAVVLACSDSRVAPELIFDQGLGDLFVVRVAGNVIAGDECGSIEYGVEHLGTPLVVVMGHSQCGAVTAAVEHAHEHGSIPELLHHIEPAVHRAEQTCPGKSKAEITDAAIRANVFGSIEELLTHSELLRSAIRAEKVQVVGAVYDLKSGMVQWLGPHPRQAELVCGSHQDGFVAARDQH